MRKVKTISDTWQEQRRFYIQGCLCESEEAPPFLREGITQNIFKGRYQKNIFRGGTKKTFLREGTKKNIFKGGYKKLCVKTKQGTPQPPAQG